MARGEGADEMAAPIDMARHPDKMFWQQVPRAYVRDVLKCLVKSYGEAYTQCAQLPKEQAHDVLPHYRRALFEAGLKDLAPRHKGVAASTHTNKAKNCNHVLTRCGQVVMTESAVEFATQVVRYAEFRGTYARSNQFLLFDSAPPPSPDAPLYCILRHGVSDDQRVPLFVNIGFPTPDCKGCVEGSTIDLLAEFKDELAQAKKAPSRAKGAQLAGRPEVS